MSFVVEVLYREVDLCFYPFLHPCVKYKFQMYVVVQF